MGAWISDHITVIAVAISAVATVFIAIFTVVLSRISSRQAQLMVVSQRAFVFALGFTPVWIRDPLTSKYNWQFRIKGPSNKK